LNLSGLRDKTIAAAEGRLDIAERILKPKTLADVANCEALAELQAKLLAGEDSKLDKRAKFVFRGKC
jgi:hypothetical protein